MKLFDKINEVLKNWLKEAKIELEDIYLFGSSVINEGNLFDEKTSDIDLILLIPNHIVSIQDRVEWMKRLLLAKIRLEIDFLQLFHRESSTKPIVSIVPLTYYELQLDIHKSNEIDFFKDNKFYSISTQKYIDIKQILLNKKINNTTKSLIAFSQSIRNKFLSVGFIYDKNPIFWDKKEEVAPKEILRNFAKISYLNSKKIEDKTDIDVGLTFLKSQLLMQRENGKYYNDLNNWLSKRLLQKGIKESLSEDNYLFLSE